MEIRQLQTFISIVELGSFTKAAEDLGYAQSTITSHIQLLESELQGAVFDRLGKKIVLTKTGMELIPYAKQMLTLYTEIKSLKVDEKAVVGDLVIGVSESITIYRLDKFIKEYRESYPNVNIILKDSNCSDLRDRLHRGELDISLTNEPEIKDRDLIVQCLKDERMVLVASPDIDLEKWLFKTESETVSESIILTEKGCMARLKFEGFLKDRRIRYTNPIELSSLEAIKKCVIIGLGISYLPYYTVKNEIEQGRINMVEVPELVDEFKTQLAYHKNKNLSLAMVKLIEIILKHSSMWI